MNTKITGVNLPRDTEERDKQDINFVDSDAKDYDAEDIFLDVCRLLVIFLIFFALAYGIWQ